MIITNEVTFLMFIKSQRKKLKRDLKIKLKVIVIGEPGTYYGTKIKYKGKGKWLYRCVGEFNLDNNRITFDYDYWDYHRKEWEKLILDWEKWTGKEVKIKLINRY